MGLTKEITTIFGLRELVHYMPSKNYRKLSKRETEASNKLYGVFTEGNQFFIAKDIRVSNTDNDWQLKNYYNGQRFIYDTGGQIKNHEGVWPNTSSKFDEKIYVVSLNKIIGAEISNPYTAYLKDVLDHVNKYLLTDPDFVKNALDEKNGKLLIKHL